MNPFKKEVPMFYKIPFKPTATPQEAVQGKTYIKELRKKISDKKIKMITVANQKERSLVSVAHV